MKIQTTSHNKHRNHTQQLVAVIAGHIGAALKHHFIDKDDILTRMLPYHATEK